MFTHMSVSRAPTLRKADPEPSIGIFWDQVTRRHTVFRRPCFATTISRRLVGAVCGRLDSRAKGDQTSASDRGRSGFRWGTGVGGVNRAPRNLGGLVKRAQLTGPLINYLNTFGIVPRGLISDPVGLCRP